MKVMIAAGGTGGHIYPGIAVAQEIMRRDANSKVHFVGTARGLETRLVPQAGFELSLIESAGLKERESRRARKRTRHPAEEFFLDAQADASVSAGRGGRAPVVMFQGRLVLTAALTNRPTLVMESNALPGWTNRVLARSSIARRFRSNRRCRTFAGKRK
jgi:UDP-N-acetylglucosamine--N-acetylmuramyl-(pentapeptide) pyrophosphoryl-undecaprenol N-acetylglucosamine transferase